LDILFILHAEHELNCSTAAVRHLSSSGVDIYSCISGGISALYGPKHGVSIKLFHNLLTKTNLIKLILTFIFFIAKISIIKKNFSIIKRNFLIFKKN